MTSTTVRPPSAPVPSFRKSVARVALFDLPAPTRDLVAECFRQFGIETVVCAHDQAPRLHKEKFEACVLPLGTTSGDIIELARSSASNSRMVIYGLGGTARDALRYSKLCINAVFHEPLDRSAALKLVRSTRGLVMHEYRRYVRVPLMTEVAVTMADNSRMTATSLEISTGGMSLRCTQPPDPGSMVEVTFSLLTLPRVWVRGIVSWKKPKSFGLRFDESDDRRRRLKDWVSTYLET